MTIIRIIAHKQIIAVLLPLYAVSYV